MSLPVMVSSCPLWRTPWWSCHSFLEGSGPFSHPWPWCSGMFWAVGAQHRALGLLSTRGGWGAQDTGRKPVRLKPACVRSQVCSGHSPSYEDLARLLAVTCPHLGQIPSHPQADSASFQLYHVVVLPVDILWDVLDM